MSDQHVNSKDNLTAKSRKRTRNPEKYQIHQQKKKVQFGLEHTTKKGNVIKAKIFCEQVECCHKKCAQRLGVTRQKTIFETFYSLDNLTKKRLFLRSVVKIRPEKENLNPTTKNKRKKYEYFLINISGVQENVCFGFFTKCLQISKDVICNAMKSAISNESAIELRGQISKRKTSQRDVKFLKIFIEKFPSYYSHYAASKSDRKYLNPYLNIKRLYKEYVIVCEFKKRRVLTEWKFRNIFNTQFNLGFHPKKADTCRTCDKLEAQIQSERANTLNKDDLLEQKKHHLQMVKFTKENFAQTINDSRDDSNKIEVLTFDLQRALETPSISTSEAYYRRQLWCYNLCIYDEKRNKPYMYFWNEAIASRGAQDISSCLIKHFSRFIPKETNKVVLYSDACPGQNRNIKTTLMIKKLLDSWPHSQLLTIEQRFFVSGHSYNSCDRCFGLIERQKKITESIYVPQHWFNVISQAKKIEPKFTTIEMKRDDFKSCKQMENIITNRKISQENEKINWTNMQKIINNRQSPFDLITEKYSVSPVQPIKVSLKKRGKKNSANTFSSVNFTPLHMSCRPINKKKYDDLMKLMAFIPSEYHWFYNTLTYENDEPNTNTNN